MSNIASPHPIWSAVLTPTRSVEVLAWLKKAPNRQRALELRGPQGETMLHWAALADSSLVLDLIGVGLDLQAVDNSGRTPLDWVLERLWMTHMEGVGNLTVLNLRKLRLQTDDLCLLLWRQGARRGVNDFDERVLAARCGLWKFLETVADMDGLPRAWSGLEGGSTALHGFCAAPDEKGRDRLLGLWCKNGLSVDAPNAAGQTPLGAAVAHRLSLAADKRLEISAVQSWISSLVAAGANPNHEHHGMPSPAELPLLEGASPELCDVLEGLMGSNTDPVEGTLTLS